jgi:hypothetical protein
MPRPKTEAAEYERLTLRLPPTLLANLRALVQETKVPLNTTVIQFLQHGVETKQKARRPRPAAVA